MGGVSDHDLLSGPGLLVPGRLVDDVDISQAAGRQAVAHAVAPPIAHLAAVGGELTDLGPGGQELGELGGLGRASGTVGVVGVEIVGEEGLAVGPVVVDGDKELLHGIGRRSLEEVLGGTTDRDNGELINFVN